MTMRADIFISGGGITGLTAAAALGVAGLSVHLADPAPAVSAAAEDGSDLRSTAFLHPSRRLLERAGLWGKLQGYSTPLDALQVVDTEGWPPTERTRRVFNASDLGDAPFGWNIPNWLTRKVLIEAVGQMENVTLHIGAGFDNLLTREREALVGLTDGRRLRVRLVIAADGVFSPVRSAVNIGTTTRRYGQKALAFVVRHDRPHNNISTEVYHSGGAFTLIPMHDHEGAHSSSIVWMVDGPDAATYVAMDDGALGTEATSRCLAELGDMMPISPRRVWPVLTQVANRLTAERTVLIAEAAHVLPPIGAQGLNTSFQDISALVDLAERRPDDLGKKEMLDAFARSRRRDLRIRADVIDLYNRVCKSDFPAVQALRSMGLAAVHDTVPIRQLIMRAGMGA